MAKEEDKFEITVKLTTATQQRTTKMALPLDMALQNGQMTGEANAALAEHVREVTRGLHERGGQASMFAELMKKHSDDDAPASDD